MFLPLSDMIAHFLEAICYRGPGENAPRLTVTSLLGKVYQQSSLNGDEDETKNPGNHHHCHIHFC